MYFSVFHSLLILNEHHHTQLILFILNLLINTQHYYYFQHMILFHPIIYYNNKYFQVKHKLLIMAFKLLNISFIIFQFLQLIIKLLH